MSASEPESCLQIYGERRMAITIAASAAVSIEDANRDIMWTLDEVFSSLVRTYTWPLNEVFHEFSMKAVRRSRTSFYSMSVLNFLLKNLQGCCLLFNYQGSFSLLSSQRQLIYIITFTIACQQLFYFSFSLSASIISVVRNSLSRISFLSTFVNRKFHLFFCVPMSS